MSKNCKIYIYNSGKLVKKIALKVNDSFIIGSGDSASIKVDNTRVSGNHIQFIFDSNGLYIQDLNSLNGTFLNGVKLENGIIKLIEKKDTIQLASKNDVIISFDSNLQQNNDLSHTDIIDQLRKKNKIYIGRSPKCDIVLNTDTISRKHAFIEKVSNDDVFYIKDLGSVNGTFVNGKKIYSKSKLLLSDVIFIGKYKLSLEGQAKDLSEEIAISATGISKTYNNGYTALKTMNIAVPSKSLLAIMGPTGCGKSTLLKCLNGDVRTTRGKVFIYNQELFSNYDYLKTQIGYVPQDDIVHKELTVYQCLYFTAKIRLDNASDDIINKKIKKILHELDITFIKDNLITDISGGQRKRVAIGVELITDPLLLFLDEPTSPLDPQTINNFLDILKKLSDNGTTIIMVTHKPEDLVRMDDVLFLSKAGSITYHGSANQYKEYFNVSNPVEVFSELSPPKSEKWINKYKSSMVIESYSDNSKEIKSIKSFSFFNQSYWLTRRYFQIKTNDRFNSLVMVLQAPIIAILICCIFKNISASVLFISSVAAIWFGTNNASREIVSENSIYKRERMFNLSIVPYIFSKISVLTFFSIVQTFLFVGILYVFYIDSLVSLTNPHLFSLWMLILSIAATCLGLFLSSVLKTTESVMSFVPLVLLPQIMLAGIIAKIDTIGIEVLSYFTISRWGTEGFAILQKEIIQEVELGVYLPFSAHEYILSRFHKDFQDFNLNGDLSLDLYAVLCIVFIMLILTYISLKIKDKQSL
tara:strand:+ start:894 stop:3155 length:2262 start_codon:yes stop_codon:yes gene_type:complete